MFSFICFAHEILIELRIVCIHSSIHGSGMFAKISVLSSLCRIPDGFVNQFKSLTVDWDKIEKVDIRLFGGFKD